MWHRTLLYLKMPSKYPVSSFREGDSVWLCFTEVVSGWLACPRFSLIADNQPTATNEYRIVHPSYSGHLLQTEDGGHDCVTVVSPEAFSSLACLVIIDSHPQSIVLFHSFMFSAIKYVEMYQLDFSSWIFIYLMYNRCGIYTNENRPWVYNFPALLLLSISTMAWNLYSSVQTVVSKVSSIHVSGQTWPDC